MVPLFVSNLPYPRRLEGLWEHFLTSWVASCRVPQSSILAVTLQPFGSCIGNEGWYKHFMRILLCLFSLLLLLSSCSSVKEIPVKGRLHDYPILTTVDDERAKYYLENYLANQRKASELDREIDLIHKTFEGLTCPQ